MGCVEEEGICEEPSCWQWEESKGMKLLKCSSSSNVLLFSVQVGWFGFSD